MQHYATIRTTDRTLAARRLCFWFLKNNQVAPPEIERGKEIDADLARADALLAELRARQDALLRRATAADRRAYNLLRDKTEARYADLLRATNSNILSFNIITPAVLHRRMLDIERLLRAFQAEFPHLPESLCVVRERHPPCCAAPPENIPASSPTCTTPTRHMSVGLRVATVSPRSTSTRAQLRSEAHT